MENYDSKEKVYEFLKKHAVAVLSTFSLDKTINATPVYFITDDELNFYFLTKSDTKKVQDIEQSTNNITLTVVDENNLVTVQAKGSVAEIEHPKYFSEIAEANAKETFGFHWPPPLAKLQSEGYLILYKFIPTWLRIADFSELNGGSSKPGTSIFHQIIS